MAKRSGLVDDQGAARDGRAPRRAAASDHTASGKYLEWQMGVIFTATGTSVVAVVAEPCSGPYNDGIRALDEVAGWLADHIFMLPNGRCRR